MRSLLVIDDDELSREVLEVLAGEAGFACTLAESGQAALELLAAGSTAPEIILADMQMPGVTGESLARLLRAACGPATRLLAMSGSPVAADRLRRFDGFLLKPFTMQELETSLAQAPAGPSSESPPTLNQAIYDNLAGSMPRAQLQALYVMCLDDAMRRMDIMRAAAEARDATAYTRAAHAIKGSCGMVGASELAALSGEMEENGLPDVGNTASFVDFMGAAVRLRRMLDAQQE